MRNRPNAPDRAALDLASESLTANPRRVRSEDLLKGCVELLIEHQGREYRLRITQNGKLILTA